MSFPVMPFMKKIQEPIIVNNYQYTQQYALDWDPASAIITKTADISDDSVIFETNGLFLTHQSFGFMVINATGDAKIVRYKALVTISAVFLSSVEVRTIDWVTAPQKLADGVFQIDSEPSQALSTRIYVRYLSGTNGTDDLIVTVTNQEIFTVGNGF